MKRVLVDLEFFFRASVSMVFEYVSSPEGLTRWFCEKVIVKDDVYDFFWEDAHEKARILDYEDDYKIVFHWEDAEEQKEYLEFCVYKSPITNQTIFNIKEYCDEDEVMDITELWESQVEELRKLLGG
ncbi:MAG: START-like domain-containing protein [Deltaproteobacteria bacterium]